MSCDVKFIGPHCWSVLHAIASSADGRIARKELDVEDVMEFLRALCKVFPCATCAAHFYTYLNTHTIGSSIQRYMYDFHHSVNERLGKTSPKYEDVVDFYNNFCSATAQTCSGACAGPQSTAQQGRVENYYKWRQTTQIPATSCFSSQWDAWYIVAWVVFAVGIACVIFSIVFVTTRPRPQPSVATRGTGVYGQRHFK